MKAANISVSVAFAAALAGAVAAVDFGPPQQTYGQLKLIIQQDDSLANKRTCTGSTTSLSLDVRTDILPDPNAPAPPGPAAVAASSFAATMDPPESSSLYLTFSRDTWRECTAEEAAERAAADTEWEPLDDMAFYAGSTYRDVQVDPRCCHDAENIDSYGDALAQSLVVTTEGGGGALTARIRGTAMGSGSVIREGKLVELAAAEAEVVVDVLVECAATVQEKYTSTNERCLGGQCRTRGEYTAITTCSAAGRRGDGSARGTISFTDLDMTFDLEALPSGFYAAAKAGINMLGAISGGGAAESALKPVVEVVAEA